MITLLSNTSAQLISRLAPSVDDHDDGWAKVDGRKAAKRNVFKWFIDNTKWIWVLLALASLTLQATRSEDVVGIHLNLLFWGELVITVLFGIEVIIRFLAALPDWRSFFSQGRNWLDLILVLGSSIIQIPSIHNSSVYPWFTIFQLARFYRVILVVPRMKPLLVSPLLSFIKQALTCITIRVARCFWEHVRFG